MILGIRQSEAHFTTLQKILQTGLREANKNRDRKLHFTRHCLDMLNHEPANICALKTSNLIYAAVENACTKETYFPTHLL